jgi:hypothetical protein
MTVDRIGHRIRAALPAGPERDSPVIRCSHTLIPAGLAGRRRLAKLSIESGHAAAAAIAVSAAIAVTGTGRGAGAPSAVA